jgi:alcohol dehydrogenase class IV
MATNPKEDYFRAFERDDKPYVSINLPFHTACANHAASTFHASRIYIIVSNSISKGPNFGELRDALGDKIVGIRYGIRHHTPWTDVLETAREVHEKKADLLITLGAGSLTDGAKVVSFVCLFHTGKGNEFLED